MTVLVEYTVSSDNVDANIKIVSGEDYVSLYKLSIPETSQATIALMDSVKEELLKTSKMGIEEIFNPDGIKRLKEDFKKRAEVIVSKKIPNISERTKDFLVGTLIHDTLGLGILEILLEDGDIEEIIINTSKEPVWVYHKAYGWLKTNLQPKSEKQIENFASIIARRVGRQITILEPLLDAYLVTGDRANATLFPVSTKGNTLSIRKFARKSWTITDFIKSGTLNLEVAAFFWLAIQYELNMIIAGGTSSGKTSLLNTLMPFIQPNHRIISIEDTRELQLPDFLHWVPLTTRLPNPEGRGEVSMLDLMINSLRMRPDRIVVGEIRRGEQAEVLFEAMHTGHSVYATLHADTVDQVVRRMTNPPINIPDVMMEALHMIAVQYRDRRKGVRRLYQLAELVPVGEAGGNVALQTNVLYRYKPNEDAITKHSESIRVFDTLRMHTGMTQKEINDDMAEKIKILSWLVKKNINIVNDVGKIMSEYYINPERIIKAAKRNVGIEEL